MRDSAGIGEYPGPIAGPDQYRSLDGVVRELLCCRIGAGARDRARFQVEWSGTPLGAEREKSSVVVSVSMSAVAGMEVLADAAKVVL